MHISKIIFVCATTIASAMAQTPTTTSIHFTSIPTSLVAGVKQTIGWAGGNGNAVNIVLQQGLASDLKDVPIPPVASGVEGNSTTWTPPKSLPDAGNYALRIEQGPDGINYSGMLQLFGGCSSCPTDAVAAFVSTSTSASKSSAGPGTASSPSPTASSSSKSGVVAPVVPSGLKTSSNSTVTPGMPGNSTTTSSGSNSTLGTGSMANMTTSNTNTTTNSTLSSSAKLYATSSKSSSSLASTSTSTSSFSSESTSSSTGSSTSPSPTKQSSGVTVAASHLALVLCALVGVIYLG